MGFEFSSSLIILLLLIIILYFSIYDISFTPKVFEFKKELMIRY